MGSAARDVRIVGRYALYGAIAAGGMATVHLGRLIGPVGFTRTVAIKRLHAQFAADPEFVSMFLDEARLAARIRHPNVVPTLDVVATGGELFLVMEYVPGESVARLSRALREREQRLPTRILSSIMAGALHGLHAAHEAKDERGHPLGIVHRDVSPQNVLVGTDGVARVLDFGVAKATGRMQTTREGQLKGKLPYMAPEQLRNVAASRQSDIYAAGVMLWELVTGERLFVGDHDAAIFAKVLEARVEAPTARLRRMAAGGAGVDAATLHALEELDSTILRALASEPEQRFETAREMALEIERKLPPATASEVADWIEHIARDVLCSRAAMVAEIESSTSLAAAGPREDSVRSLPQGDAPPVSDPSGALERSHDASGAVTRLDGRRTVSEPPAGETLALPRDPEGAPPAYAPAVDAPLVTQPSSISVASGAREGAAAARPTHSRVVAAALAALVLGAGLLATALAYRHRQVIDASGPSDASAGSTSEATSAASTLATASTASATSATSDASAPPEGTASVKALAPARPTRRAHPGTPPARTAASSTEPKPAPAAGADCVWFDAEGVKRYKPQCLGK